MKAPVRKLPLLVTATAAIALASMLLVGCSGDDDPPATPTPPPPTATPAPAPPVTMITMDNSFATTAITARVGQKVTVNMKNDGQRPHTFTIDTVVDSGRLAAGESKTIEFTPSQAGTLTYYCTVHGQAAMSGTVTVSASGALPAEPEQQPRT